MTVDNATQIIGNVISNTLAEYDQSPDSRVKDKLGVVTRIPHPLDIVSPQDQLFSLDMALKDVALKATPVSLIENANSTASELKRISTDYFVRVPVAPVAGANLDIDDGLAYAVVFKTLGLIWREYGDYDQRADSIINTYVQAYRTYLADLIAGVVGTGKETYIRFSADGTAWHSSFTTGDIYISFKKIDTATWTPAIQFVGSNGRNFDDTLNYTGNAGKVVAVNALENGIELVPQATGGATTFLGLADTPTAYVAGQVVAVNPAGNGLELIAPSTGGGATTFLGLTDTPTAYTANQVVAVDATGTGLTLIPPPTGGGVAGANAFGDNPFYDGTNGGVINLDASTNNVFYLYPPTNAELHFTLFNDGGTQVPALWGTTYTFMLVSSGTVAITFDPTLSILGNATVGLGTSSPATSITMTILKMVYTGYDWYVISNTVITDANG